EQVISSQSPSSSSLSSSSSLQLSTAQSPSSPPSSPTSQAPQLLADNNSPPIADAGHSRPDKTINEGSLVTLDGSASHDPDGDVLAYNWTQTSDPQVVLNGANTPKATFTAPSNLQEDTTLFFKLTVTDKAGLSDSAVQKITVKRSTSVPPPPDTGTEQIYTAKPGGRVFTKMNPSGGNCKSDGIRFNIANEHSLVDRESTWIFTLNNDPASCTDKPWWSPKIGSHGSTGEGSGLYEASVPYSGGFKSMRTEGPHPQYHSCSGYTHGDVPPMPKGKPIGVKTAQWRIPNGVHVEFWYDFTGGGKGPWKKYASLDDTLPGHCNGGSINGPIGMNGELIGPAKAQDTMRMNGGSATYISGSIVELAPGQSPRGGIDSSLSSLSLSSATDDNLVASHQAIAKESVFDKGLSDGEKDAKEIVPPSAMRSDQKTIAPPPSAMTSDDVDCESPDNMSGQDSIDYCKGYEQGFAEQNNMMAEK
ncbi:MAG: PKD domain-containing protein, partial [Nitrososphaeraceae archaeon]